MAPAPPLMTIRDYFSTPVTVKPMELARGALRVRDAPSPRHQSAVACLFRALDAHVREQAAGEMWLAPLDISVLSGHDAVVVQPDLLFIASESAWIVQDRVRGAPELVIEVLSPEPRIGSTEERIGWFAQYGVRECWLVHLDRREVTVIEFADRLIARSRVFSSNEPLASVVLPAFTSTLSQILNER